MNAMNVLDIALWSVQGFLALFFLAAGAPKLFGRGIEKWTGFSDLPRSQVVFTGVAEVLGAAGLVLPMATGVLPWLTPLAAVGLAIIVLMAAGFHVRADERLAAVETGLWAGIAAAVAIGRWDLVASSADVSPWVLVAALGLLVPAAIINVIVLWKRSEESGTLADDRGDRQRGEESISDERRSPARRLRSPAHTTSEA
ncbi:MAG: DoxX family protein [Actinomycetota bacterium]